MVYFRFAMFPLIYCGKYIGITVLLNEMTKESCLQVKVNREVLVSESKSYESDTLEP